MPAATIPTSLNTLQRHYLRIIRQWPLEKLRKVSIHPALEHRLLALSPAGTSSTHAQSAPQVPPPAGGNDALAVPIAAKAEAKSKNPKDDEEQVNALYSLLENRYSSTYRVTAHLLEPAFKPSYYGDLAAEMQQAPARGWWAKRMLRLKNLIRINN